MRFTRHRSVDGDSSLDHSVLGADGLSERSSGRPGAGGMRSIHEVRTEGGGELVRIICRHDAFREVPEPLAGADSIGHDHRAAACERLEHHQREWLEPARNGHDARGLVEPVHCRRVRDWVVELTIHAVNSSELFEHDPIGTSAPVSHGLADEDSARVGGFVTKTSQCLDDLLGRFSGLQPPDEEHTWLDADVIHGSPRLQVDGGRDDVDGSLAGPFGAAVRTDVAVSASARRAPTRSSPNEIARRAGTGPSLHLLRTSSGRCRCTTTDPESSKPCAFHSGTSTMSNVPT